MKKKFCLFVLPLVAVSLAGCKKKPTTPEEPEEPTPQISISGASEWGVNGITTYTSSVEGVTWTSSDPSVATISESGQLVGISAGTVTLTAAKEGYESATFTVTVIANPYSFTSEELGWYYGTFKGASGTLDVQSTVASFEEDGVIKTIFPTKIVEEEFSYRDTSGMIAKNVKETYKAVYFEGKFNSTPYRLKFTASEFKLIELDKFDGEKFVKYAEYHPTEFSSFSGAYNGYGDIDDYNVVYIYSNEEVDAGEGHIGYKVNGYSKAYAQFSSTSFVSELGYQTVKGENDTFSYELAFQIFDASDGEYFEGVLGKNPETTGLKFYGDTSDAFYADPTPFLTNIYNEDGEALSNSWEYDWDTFEPVFHIGTDTYSLGISRDEHGLKYIFSGENLNTYEVRIGEEWSYKVGETTKKFGLACTLLTGTYLETIYENADNSSTFEYWYDTDWDTWEDILVANFDNTAILEDDISLYVAGDGFVGLKFTSNEKEVIINKLTSALIDVSVDGASEKYVSRSYIASIFNKTLTNGRYDLTIDTANHEYIIGGVGTPISFAYSEDFNQVVASTGSTLILLVDKDQGFYVSFNTVTNQIAPLLEKNSYESLYGQYTSDGVNVYELSATGLTVNGNATEWSLVALQTSSSITVAFAFTSGASSYILVPSFEKSAGLYLVKDSGFQFVSTLVDKEIADKLVGKYLCETEYGVETIEFTSDYKLYADVYSDETSSLVPTQFNYYISYASGVISLNLQVGEGYATFRKLDYALSIGNLAYLNPALYYGQGIYKSSDNQTVVSVWENRITYCTKTSSATNPVSPTSEKILSIVESSENVFTITVQSGRVYTLTLNESHQFVSFEVDGEEFSKVGEELFEHIISGDSVSVTISEAQHTLKFTGGYSSSYNEFRCTVSFDNAPSDMGQFGLRAFIDDDGNVCFFFNGALTPIKIYADGNGDLVAEYIEGSSVPTPPPAPPAP